MDGRGPGAIIHPINALLAPRWELEAAG